MNFSIEAYAVEVFGTRGDVGDGSVGGVRGGGDGQANEGSG